MADIKTLDFALEPADKDRIAYLVGPEDENLKQICKRLGVKITYSGAHFQVSGMEGQAKKAIKLRKDAKRRLQVDGEHPFASFIQASQSSYFPLPFSE